MKIALTGASGRVAKGIIALAAQQGHELVLIDRIDPPDSPFRFIQAEVADYDALVGAFAGCDGVIHMAAIPVPGKLPDHVVHNNNVVGSYNVLRAAAENGIMRVCQASSVNAIGHAFSRVPRYDYFPLDEQHPNYGEDPYSLSKWICEEQGRAFARRYDGMAIASLRFHHVVPDRQGAIDIYGHDPNVAKHLWAWTELNAAADACLKSLTAPFVGHEAFFVVAPQTISGMPSRDLARQHLPHVPITGALDGDASFFSSHKAERMLGWRHPRL